MTKRPPVHKSGIHIGKLRLRGRVLRDLIHSDHGPIVIDEVEADVDVGGDLVNGKTPPKQPAPRKRQRRTATAKRRALGHVIAGVLSIGGMVAASGIATALGFGG